MWLKICQLYSNKKVQNQGISNLNEKVRTPMTTKKFVVRHMSWSEMKMFFSFPFSLIES